ncbi:MAG: hypothetical protein A3G96_03105 [Gammaproteobacteria bacterium RIFCSPLOWO2_12_FULL_52_10]|nr:MAG: hypothetical protein A3G96_03105 [Gammaproteobacteria bacterium RIFCSPLOWO2_12_FULL_52_10]
MTASKHPQPALAGITAPEVADYLRQHPEFFNDYQDLLNELRVPHQSGDAISLVEKQLKVLREQNKQARKRMVALIEIARHNEELARRMHQLVLTLMDAANAREIFTILYENLKKNFKADRVAIRVFANPAFIDSFAGEEFAGRDLAEQKLFKSVIEKRLPISGKLKRQQQVFLFGDGGDAIQSAVIVPLHGEDWGGVLVIGSHDPEKFQENMGVELLANLAKVLSLIIKPWVSVK